MNMSSCGSLLSKLSTGLGLGNLEILAQHGDWGQMHHTTERRGFSPSHSSYIRRLHLHCRKDYRGLRVLTANM